MKMILYNQSKKKLTNVKICDIILYLNTCKSHNERKEYEILMNEKTTPTLGVEVIADVLISKFKHITIDGQHIRCSRTKLGKLLTLIQVLYIKCVGKQLFDDKIYSDVCGTIIPSLNTLNYPYDIVGKTVGGGADGCFERNEEIAENLIIYENDDYESIGDFFHMDIDVDQLIYNVFITFGSYEGRELGKYIDEFKHNLCNNNILDEKTTRNFLLNIPQKLLEQGNPIIDYINSYM